MLIEKLIALSGSIWFLLASAHILLLRSPLLG
jgi:hypothetical protein